MPDRRPPPSAPSLPPRPAPRRTSLTDSQLAQIEMTARAAGVPHEPWLAWARAAAPGWGPDEATRRACAGAATEPTWAVSPERAAAEQPRRRWRWR